MGEPSWEFPPVEMFAWAARAGEGAPDHGAHRGLDLPPSEEQEAEHRDEAIEKGIDVAHFAATTAEIYEIFTVSGVPLEAAHAGFLAAAAETLAPLDGALVMLITAHELYKAFSSDQRIEAQKGFAYGVLWEVLGVEDVEDPTTHGHLMDVEVPKTSAQARGWEEGVDGGREMGRRPEVKEAITRALAYEMAAQKRDLDTDPGHRAWKVAVERVLNGVWDRVKENPSVQNRSLNWKGDADGFPRGH